MSSSLLGYPEVEERLRAEIASGSISHAYIIAGPPQVGKMVLALDIARALNCEGQDQPCGQCSHCRKVSSGNHPDVQVLGLVKDQKGDRLRKEIGIDQVRTLQHDAGLHPYWGRFRVFIIDEAQRLSTEAANCLLKTLEEPPPACMIILLTVDEGPLLQTVVSRCRLVHMRTLSSAAIEATLLDRGAGPEEARLLARLSRGRIGWALAAATDEKILAGRSGALEELGRAMSGSLAERFRLAEEMAAEYYKDREALGVKLQTWLAWWRDLFLIKGNYGQGVVNVDRAESLQNWEPRVSLSETVIFIKTIITTMEALERNANPRMALEALMLEAPGQLTRAPA